MAAPAYASVGTSYAGNATRTSDGGFDLGKPAGTTAGDLLLAFLLYDTTTDLDTVPTGFTSIANLDHSSIGIEVYWKEAGASEPSTYNWGFPFIRPVVGFIVRVTGSDTTSPIDVQGSAVFFSSADPVAPSIITTDADRLLFACYVAEDNGTEAINSYPSGYTAIMSLADGGNNIFAGAAYKTQASAGASGTATFDLSGCGPRSIALHFAIKPAAGGGVSYDETATITAAATVAANETYTAPAYDETASVTATPTVEATETFGAGTFDETASIVATATVFATETYTAPAYDETASVTATATVNATETFGAGAYNETASIAATATVSATETYTAPAYDETASVTATATVEASEVFTEPGGAFNETADISATATVNASESYSGPAYSETASITFAALVEASEIYVGPGAGETASITGTVTVDASETWEPPHYSETTSIIGLLTVTAVHTFSTPSALPAGISRLSAERVGGFFAERIGRA